MTPFLREDELAELCHPLTQPAAIRRYLRRIGVPFCTRPDGRPVVPRQAVAEALGARQVANDEATEPNMDNLVKLFKKGGRGG